MKYLYIGIYIHTYMMQKLTDTTTRASGVDKEKPLVAVELRCR